MVGSVPASDADLTLSRVTEAELPTLIRLQRAAYAPWIPILGLEPLPYRADYGALLRDHEAWLARTAEGDEAGALILQVLADHLLIWSVAVAEGRHGQGIGRALMAFAEEEAARRGLTEIRLYTNVLMARNIALYWHLGYGESGREVTADGRHIIHMTKRIAGG
jgi:ribosomal protein S18 acetylase RimI-like enzyme